MLKPPLREHLAQRPDEEEGRPQVGVPPRAAALEAKGLFEASESPF